MQLSREPKREWENEHYYYVVSSGIRLTVQCKRTAETLKMLHLQLQLPRSVIKLTPDDVSTK